MNQSKKSKICIISDVHGNFEKYLNIVKQNDFTLQLGDLAFNYWFLKDINPNNHVYFKGNHDNFEETSYHDLGKYGLKTLNNVEFFYIRGAFSIDWKYRIKLERDTGYKTWWKEEELSDEDLSDAYNLYCSIKPEILITHDVPRSISKDIGNPAILSSWDYNPDTFTTRTSEWLEKCWIYHQPKLYVAGHYHISVDKIYDNTRFICLPELGTVDVYPDATVDHRYIKI